MSKLHPKVQGTTNPSDPPASSVREVIQANRFAQRADVVEVYLGDAARTMFHAARVQKFADVIAKKSDGSFGLGEGKGTDMAKLVEQFKATGPLVGRITEQEVVIEKLSRVQEHDSAGKLVDTYDSPGPQGKLDAHNFLLVFNTSSSKWEQALPNGIPIKVIIATSP